MTARRPAIALRGVRAVTFDFGNTLVPVDRAALSAVVAVTARRVGDRLGPFDEAGFLTAWAEERERQFRDEIPRFREADMAERFVRVLARLRGMAPPPADEPWDDVAAATRSDPDEVAWAVGVYSDAFVAAIPPVPAVGEMLARLARTHDLGILSNWPLAATIDRYVEASGWRPHLRAVVVSQRVGTIKPHPAIFAAALDALRVADPSGALHVGDDWAADVVGAKGAGWRAAYLRSRPDDSPLPSSERDDAVTPDAELARLDDLEPLLAG